MLLYNDFGCGTEALIQIVDPDRDCLTAVEGNTQQ